MVGREGLGLDFPFVLVELDSEASVFVDAGDLRRPGVVLVDGCEDNFSFAVGNGLEQTGFCV